MCRESKCRQHQYVTAPVHDAPRRLDTSARRYIGIHYDEIRIQRLGQVHRLVTGAGFPEHLDARVPRQHAHHPCAHRVLAIGDHESYHRLLPQSFGI